MRATIKTNFTSALLAAAMGAVPGAFAAFTYPNCADVAATDFSMETLVANATDKLTEEPMKMGFDMDAAGNVSVYFTQRQGLLRKYDPIKKATMQIGDLSKYPGFPTSFSGGSDGLIGIAMDPAFKSNHLIYLDISTKTDWRVVRYAINGETLDMASEKVVITIPQQPLSQHPGSALAFDKAGNLWITTGDNHLEWPAANTNDLRGKILRIHPTPEGGYTIPTGNLFAASDKTKPEIYIMGNRNPYTITLDTVRNAVTWGDVGPDAGLITEERDFATQPGFHGWPFYSGNQVPQGKGAGTVDKPINNDPKNTGLSDLPPAIPGFDNYKESCSITGPVYYYNPASPSTVKMPPHFNGIWFVSDFSHFAVEGLNLDAAGSKILGRQPIFANMPLDRILDFQTGPDGAFYFVNYAGYRDFTSKTGIVRIIYKGNCRPTTANAFHKPEWADRAIQVQGLVVSISSAGAHTLQVKDLAGRLLATRAGRGQAKYDLSGIGSRGIRIVSVTTEQGSFAWKMVR